VLRNQKAVFWSDLAPNTLSTPRTNIGSYLNLNRDGQEAIERLRRASIHVSHDYFLMGRIAETIRTLDVQRGSDNEKASHRVFKQQEVLDGIERFSHRENQKLRWAG
jgi:hypothetical protein